jgi:hypothetical protein
MGRIAGIFIGSEEGGQVSLAGEIRQAAAVRAAVGAIATNFALLSRTTYDHTVESPRVQLEA